MCLHLHICLASGIWRQLALLLFVSSVSWMVNEVSFDSFLLVCFVVNSKVAWIKWIVYLLIQNSILKILQKDLQSFVDYKTDSSISITSLWHHGENPKSWYGHYIDVGKTSPGLNLHGEFSFTIVFRQKLLHDGVWLAPPSPLSLVEQLVGASLLP